MAANGTAVVDFGAFPGTDVATVAVTGQASILAGSRVDAWLVGDATTDHSEDEHLMLKQEIDVVVARSSIVAGTGFTITAVCNDKSRMWGKFNVDWAWA
jgi:isochorismate hydrolase